jgi:hypothetical protein
MRSPPFYFLTCALAVVAAVVAVASQVDAGRAAGTAAKAAEARSPEDREALQSVVHSYVSRANCLSRVAAAVFVLALGGWAFSLLRREPGWQSIPLLLLCLAGLLQLLLV